MRNKNKSESNIYSWQQAIIKHKQMINKGEKTNYCMKKVMTK